MRTPFGNRGRSPRTALAGLVVLSSLVAIGSVQRAWASAPKPPVSDCEDNLKNAQNGADDPDQFRNTLLRHFVEEFQKLKRAPSYEEFRKKLEAEQLPLSGLFKKGDYAPETKLEDDFEYPFASFAELKNEGTRIYRDAQRMRWNLIRAYLQVMRVTQRTPFLSEVADELRLDLARVSELVGESPVTSGKDERIFSNFLELKAAAKAVNPKAFASVIDTDYFNRERLERLVDAIKKRKRLIVTTAVAHSPVNREFLNALTHYCKLNDAEILVYPANMMTEGLDPVLLETPGVHILTHSIELSSSMQLNTIKLLAKQIWPLTGLDRLGKRGQSQILGSPKMHERIVPTKNNDIAPHFLVTTGAITEPYYQGRLYLQGRTNAIARNDHMMGALVLERNNGGPETVGIEAVTGIYHHRYIEFIREKGGFADLNFFYTAADRQSIRAKAIAPGDIHVGVTNQGVLKALPNLIRMFDPEVIAVHDLLDGRSVSPHETDKLMSLADAASRGLLDVEREIREVSVFINALLTTSARLKIVIVPSNHNEWLPRWLNSGQFMRDNFNRKFGLELANVKLAGQDPLEYAVRKHVEYNKQDRVIFLRKGESFKVGDVHRVELADHGDAGANGGKGSLRALQRANDRSVFGHTHTQARLNGTVNNGTLTELKLHYALGGASNWVQSLAIVGPNGEIQALRFVDNELHAPLGNATPPAEQFFEEGFPRIIENTPEEWGDQVDQYSPGLRSRSPFDREG